MWVAEVPPAVPVAPHQPPDAPEVAASVPASVATPRADDSETPLFGARGKARKLTAEVTHLRSELERLRVEMNRLGVLPAVELEQFRERLRREIAEQAAAAQEQKADLDRRLRELRQQVVVTEETALLQEAGVYEYRHPLSDAVAYQAAPAGLQGQIKSMTKREGGAVLAPTGWTVNGSAAEGRVRDFSKLMLRAYNAEAANLVRGLKPYKLDSAVERLGKVAATIAQARFARLTFPEFG